MAKSKNKPRPPAQPEAAAVPSSLELTATAVFDVASASDEGAALPRFRMVAYTGAPMRIAGWRYPVIIDLAGLAIPSQSRPIRFSHDPTAGVGHTDSIRIDGGQLISTGVISRDTPAAREVVSSSKNGFPWQASVGTTVDEFEFVKDRQTVMVNGQEHAGPLNVVRKATLSEISFVDLGADSQTSAMVAASAGNTNSLPHEEPSDMDANENTTVADTDENDREPNNQGEPTPPVAAAVTASSTVDDIRAEATAEVSRIASIRQLCCGRFPDVEAKAIAEGWDATKCELEVLRANRPRTPAVHMHDKTVNGCVLEAACLMTGRVDKIEAMFDDQTLDAATNRFRGGIGLQELLLEAAWANGYTGRNFRDSRAVLRYAFNPTLEAGFSTIDIGGILSNVANKFLLDGFFSVERTWRNVTAVRNVSDFKTVTSYRLVGKDQYEQVAPGGELKHGTLGEEKYENKADTYGLVLSIDRRDIINDDLDAITTVPRKLGRGSGLKINDVFWSTFLANSTFFSAGNNNFITGATTALSIDGLTEGEVTFMDQVDSDGKPIGIMPAILLAPAGAVGDRLAAVQVDGVAGHDGKHQVPGLQPAPGQVPCRGEPLPVQRPVHGQLGQGVVSAGRAERPAGDRGRVPQRPGVAHDRNGRGRLQQARRADAGLPRFWRRAARPARRRESQGRGVIANPLNTQA